MVMGMSMPMRLAMMMMVVVVVVMSIMRVVMVPMADQTITVSRLLLHRMNVKVCGVITAACVAHIGIYLFGF